MRKDEIIHKKIRPKKSRPDVWEMDCTLDFEDGLPPQRVRKDSPYKTEAEVSAWADRMLLKAYRQGRQKTRDQKREEKQAAKALHIPTLSAFAPDYVSKHLIANQRAKATIRLREWCLDFHLLPRFGSRLLTSFTLLDYQDLKSDLLKEGLKPNTINQIVGTLVTLLRCAYRWNVLREAPVVVERLKLEDTEVEFYREEEYEALACAVTGMKRVFVLLGGDAGLRLGEMMGLRWMDISFKSNELHIRQQVTESGEITPPKWKKTRKVPMTRRLAKALEETRHLAERVLVKEDGTYVSRSNLRVWLRHAERGAKVAGAKSAHKLRHTFATLLVARGATVMQLKALLGHRSIQTTMKYMHLLDGATVAAIGLLERGHGEKMERK